MNVLRWIFGFPLATGISIGLLYVSNVYAINGIYISRLYFMVELFRIAASVFCLSLWVFLTCLFIPFYKKIAGLVPTALAFTLIAIAILEDLKTTQRTDITRNYIIPLTVIFISFFVGYVVSYLVFKGKGWGRLKKGPARELHELYPY